MGRTPSEEMENETVFYDLVKPVFARKVPF
jgi:hypothetical protein